MRRRIFNKRFGKRLLAMGLAFTMLFQPIGDSYAMAMDPKEPIHLAVATMPKEISQSDTFYVGTTSADLQENIGNSYLFMIGRGGNAENAADVTLKISDLTAKYGEDYRIRIYDGHPFFAKEAESPEDNQSLLEMIEENRDQQYEETLSEEEQLERQQELAKTLEEALAEEESEEASDGADAAAEDAQLSEDATVSEDVQATEEAQDTEAASDEDVQITENAQSAEDALTEDAPSTEDVQTEEDAQTTEEETTTEALEGEAQKAEFSKNELKAAVQAQTGVESDREAMESTQQTMVDVLSSAGNSLTNLISGATLKVEFAAGIINYKRLVNQIEYKTATA